MKPSALIYLSAVSFISGIFVSAFLAPSNLFWWLFLNLGICILAGAVLCRAEKKYILITASVVLFFFLGHQTHLGAVSEADPYIAYRDTGERVELTGIIVREPDTRDSSIRYTIRTEPEGELVLTTTHHFPKYSYGDRLVLHGRLTTPVVFDDFNYKEYLMKDDIRTVIYYPTITFVSSGNGSILKSTLLKSKNALRKSINRSLPYPQNELLLAMTLGDRQGLEANLKERFSRIGIRHIIAISGMHITIVAGMIISVLIQGLRLSNNFSFFSSVFLIFAYISMIGSPPSAVRAGIMACILLLAKKIKRDYFAWSALLFSASLMLAFNPLLLRFDIGFQLSFLAVAGILYLSPMIEKYLNKITKSESSWLINIISITLGAQISTLPILIHNFGMIPIISPLANILIVPIVSFIIMSGFVGMIAGLISEIAGIFFSFPVYILLSYVLQLSNILDQPGISHIVFQSTNTFWIPLFYISVFFYVQMKKTAPQNQTEFSVTRSN
jgi:ComEC/Rec2-related protein